MLMAIYLFWYLVFLKLQLLIIASQLLVRQLYQKYKYFKYDKLI